MNKKQLNEEYVILVDQNDCEIGIQEKIKAHQYGQLHRAFSVFIFSKHYRGNHFENSKLLLQQRQKNKYHSGGLWTNTCCSHPRPHENIIHAGERRLEEEVGLVVNLKKAGVFQYRAKLNQNLIENEIDHVLVGSMDMDIQAINFNQEEISDVRWISVLELQKDLKNRPKKYTSWLVAALKIALA